MTSCIQLTCTDVISLSSGAGIGNHDFLFSASEMGHIIPPVHMPLEILKNSTHSFFQQLSFFLPGASFGPLDPKVNRASVKFQLYKKKSHTTVDYFVLILVASESFPSRINDSCLLLSLALSPYTRRLRCPESENRRSSLHCWIDIRILQ